jgi:hypothetical protein
MGALLVKAQQHSSIRIQDLTKVVIARKRLGLAEKRLVPFEAAWNVASTNGRLMCVSSHFCSRPNENKIRYGYRHRA